MFGLHLHATSSSEVRRTSGSFTNLLPFITGFRIRAQIIRMFANTLQPLAQPSGLIKPSPQLLLPAVSSLLIVSACITPI